MSGDDSLPADLGWLAVGLLVGGIAAAAVFAALGPALGSVGADDRAAVDRTNLTLPDETERLHDRGITGSNVTVGVLEATGFDRGHPALADRVVAARAFGQGNHVTNGGVNAHGTAAAVTVAETAPDADLLLANADSPDASVRALRWLVDRDADVVVVQFSRLGAPDDGSARLSRAASAARDRGVAVVAPTGNLGRSHWEGSFRPDDDGTHRFGDRVGNELRPLGPSASAGDRRASVSLAWAGDADLKLDVYRVSPNGPERVATSEPVPNRRQRVERVRTTLGPGTHAVAVRTADPAAAGRVAGTDFEVRSPTHALDRARPNGSIAAPATARGVIAVGGYERDTETVAPYSGRGPTADGRRGVDVVAPVDLWEPWPGSGEHGTSVAAAYAGGAAALALDADPSLSAGDLERELAASAAAVGDGAPERAAGHGRLDAVGAVDRVTESSIASETATTPAAGGPDDVGVIAVTVAAIPLVTAGVALRRPRRSPNGGHTDE